MDFVARKTSRGIPEKGGGTLETTDEKIRELIASSERREGDGFLWIHDRM
jgi:hypothetical protein